MNAIEIAGLSKSFRVGFWRKKIRAVRHVELSIKRGEIFGLIGPNGSGKTTTFKMVTGLMTPDTGQIRIHGHDAASIEARRHIGFLPENPYFYEHLKVPELLQFYGQLHGLPSTTIKSRTKDLIELVGLGHAVNRPIKRFSKGMRQRAGLAQALMNDPEIVILDEPQSGLDPMGRRDVRELIHSLKEAGKTVVFSSHILPDVEAVCDRVAVIHRGEVVDHGSLSDLLARSERRYEIVASGPDFTPNSLRLVGTRGEANLYNLQHGREIGEGLQELIQNGMVIHDVTSGQEALESVLLADLKKAGEEE